MFKQKSGYGLVLLLMSFLAISLPIATNLVQQRQDQRSSAAENKYSIKISPNERIVSVGYTTDFELKFSKNIKNKTVEWFTNKGSIIKVNKKSGKILGLLPGEAVVYAYSPSTKIKVSAKVYVKTYFKVTRYPKTMKVGENNRVSVVVSPNSIAHFESLNKNVLSVDEHSGILKAKKKGTAYIKVTASETAEIKNLKITVK